MPDLLVIAAAVFVFVVWTGLVFVVGVFAERRAAEKWAEVERALNRVGSDPDAAMAAWRKVSDAIDDASDVVGLPPEGDERRPR